MTVGKFFIVNALIYNLLLIIIYFSKKRFQSLENKIYKGIMIISFVGVILEILCRVIIPLMNNYPLLNFIITRGYLVYLLTWVTLFTFYTIVVSHENNNNFLSINNSVLKKYIILFVIIFIISFILVLSLPMYYYNDDNLIYTYGPSVLTVYFVSFIYIIIGIVRMMFNIKSKKYLPMIIFIMMGTIVTIVQLYYPSLLLATSMEVFITFLMYFTIENPDLMIIDEINKNRKILKRNVAEKDNFLFRMVQKIRKPLNNILKYSNNLNDDVSFEEQLKKINHNAIVASNVINNVLDITPIDVSNIKIQQTTFNLHVLVEEIKIKYTKLCQNKGIDFNISVTKNIPEIILGDGVRLKQIIFSLLSSSLQFTSKGFIEVNIDCILKFDICRLIISVENSGQEISIDKINEILSIDEELTSEELKNVNSYKLNLKSIKKIIHLLKGTILIDSDTENGTEVTIIIDYKTILKKINNTRLFDKYIDLKCKKNILLLSSDESINRIFEKIVSTSEIIHFDYSLYLNDCLNNIRKNNQYDYIFLNTINETFSPLLVLSKIKSINSKQKVVIILQKKDEYLGKHLLDDGFYKYMIDDSLSEKLLDIINK